MQKLEDNRREEFCQQYIIDFNGTRAAEVAGYSKRSARSQASDLLTNPNIQKRISGLLKNRSKRTQITQDMVLRELAILGFSDFKNYGKVGKDGSLEFYPISKRSGQQTRAIESMKQSSKGTLLKLHGKVRPLELLGKHLGMFADTHNVNLTGGIKVLTAVPRPKKPEGMIDEQEK